jgi:hypothetical protein
VLTHDYLSPCYFDDRLAAWNYCSYNFKLKVMIN